MMGAWAKAVTTEEEGDGVSRVEVKGLTGGVCESRWL